MAKPRNQAELVKQKLDENPPEFEESLSMPGLMSFFDTIPVDAEIKEMKVKLPRLEKLGTRPREEIADALVSLLDYKDGVSGFEWYIGEPTLNVFYVENFSQKRPRTDAELAELTSIFVTVLKSRRDITGIKWIFGEGHVTITSAS